MKDYINFTNVNCKDCYKCVRHCPVKSIRFVDHKAEIIKEECVLCGNCYLYCPQNAKEIRNDLPIAKSLIKSGNEVYVSLAPSFVSVLNANFKTVEKALLKLGFKGVEETAIGAQIVTNEYCEIIDNIVTNRLDNNVVISTCCPTINLLITKYYPECVKHMAPVASPMVVHAEKIKSEHKNCCVIFIGPCLSKKEEADENINSCDCVLTFEDLKVWLNEENIDLSLEKEKNEKKYKTRLYPISSGIIETMTKNEEFEYIAVDGLENCKKVLNEIKNGNIRNCFIEMSSCDNGCIGGPAAKNKNDIIKNKLAVIKHSGNDKYEYGELSFNSSHDFKENPIKAPETSDIVIKAMLEKIGKYSKEDELNCGSCGYDSCKDKAIAMFSNKSEPYMCLPYLKNKATSYMVDLLDNTPNGVIVVNDKLEIESINKAACKIFNLSQFDNNIGQPISMLMNVNQYVISFSTKENVYGDISYLSDYKKYIDQTIIYNEKYNVLMLIIKDITTEMKTKIEKEKISKDTIQVTDEIIKKQMRAVQGIAMLLGETTAEAKVALEKLKESFND